MNETNNERAGGHAIVRIVIEPEIASTKLPPDALPGLEPNLRRQVEREFERIEFRKPLD